MKHQLLLSSLLTLFGIIQMNAQSFENYYFQGEYTGPCHCFESREGNFFINCNFYDKSYIHTKLTKISSIGNILWTKTYNYVADNKSCYYNVNIYEGIGEELILPYYVRTAVLNYQARIYRIDKATGDIIGQDNFELNSIAHKEQENVYDFNIKDDNYQFIHLLKDDYHDLVLINLDKNLSILSTDTLISVHSDVIISEYEDAIYTTNGCCLTKIDYGNGIRDSINLFEHSPINSGRMSLTENKDYIAVKLSSWRHSAHLFLIDKKSFELIQSCYLSEASIRDIALLDNNQVLALHNRYQSADYIFPIPIKVMLFDTSLNLIKKGEYGLPPTAAYDIGVTANQKYFYVGGSKMPKNIPNSSEELNQGHLYFLKEDLANLRPVYQPKDELPLGVNVFPNPTANQLNILIDPEINLPIEGNMISTEGRLIKSFTISEHDATIDMSPYPIGTYFLELKSDKEYRKEKIIKMW